MYEKGIALNRLDGYFINMENESSNSRSVLILEPIRLVSRMDWILLLLPVQISIYICTLNSAYNPSQYSLQNDHPTEYPDSNKHPVTLSREGELVKWAVLLRVTLCFSMPCLSVNA